MFNDYTDTSILILPFMREMCYFILISLFLILNTSVLSTVTDRIVGLLKPIQWLEKADFSTRPTHPSSWQTHSGQPEHAVY